jgi:SAM-dependent methyltransferase
MAEMTEQEKELIRQGIRGKYVQVATRGTACCFSYPTGLEGLRLQGYPLEVVKDFPAGTIESFCGVGNPFSLGPLYPGEAVLDVGCGGGFDAFVAAQMVGPKGQVVGVDATPEMIARAEANLVQVGLTNVRFEVAEAESLPFPDNSFQAVISNGVFNLTLDKEQALKEAHRVLAPGGRLLLADMVLVSPLPEDQAGRLENWYQ